MATATLSTNPASVPASTSEPSPIRFLPNEVPYEVVDGRIVVLPPMGILESDITFFLASALNQAVKAQHLGKVVVELLFRIDVRPQPEAAAGPGVRLAIEVALRKASARRRSLGHGAGPCCRSGE